MDNRLYNIKPASCCKQEQDSDCGITINLSEEPNSEYLLKSEAFCLFLRKGQYALISQLPDTTQFVKKGYADRTYLTEDALDILDLYVTIAYFDENIHDIVESEVESATYSRTQIDTALALKADSGDLSAVATSGSYDDLQNTPTNVSQFTNDAGYLTEHQDISGKADKSEMSVEPGTGADADKTTITLKQDTSATVLTAHQDISGKANTADLATVATTGLYNDLSGKPTIPAALVLSNWNESDTTSKAYILNKPTIPTIPTNVSAFNNDAGYLTQHQDLTNYVQKSQTAGLLKNDGTVDTTQYLSQHQDISGKDDKMPITQVASGTTTINAAVNTYYEVAGEVGALAITLPTPTDLTKVSMVVVHLAAGTTPNVVIGSTETIDYSATYDISAGKEYEINCLFNGDKWVVADMEVV